MTFFKSSTSKQSPLAPCPTLSRLQKCSSWPCIHQDGKGWPDGRIVWGTSALHQPNCEPSTSRAVEPCDISRKIDGARQWWNVSQFVDDPGLTSENAAFALYRLGTLLPFMSTSDFSELKASKLLDKLAVHVNKGASDLGAAAIMRALHGCARLQYNSKELTELLALRAREIASKFTPLESATVFWALAVLPFTIPRPLLADLELSVSSNAHLMSPEDIRKVWVSYAALKKVPSPDCQEKLLDRIEMDMRSYSNSQLAECMRAWCTLGVLPKTVLLSHLQMVANRRPEAPTSLMDRGSIGPNPACMPALAANGLSVGPLPQIKVPGYNDSNTRYPRLVFPPRASPAPVSLPVASPDASTTALNNSVPLRSGLSRKLPLSFQARSTSSRSAAASNSPAMGGIQLVSPRRNVLQAGTSVMLRAASTELRATAKRSKQGTFS
eukprot:jgi/Botrbrau1/14124/Bobra.182_3s0067.1